MFASGLVVACAGGVGYYLIQPAVLDAPESVHVGDVFPLCGQQVSFDISSRNPLKPVEIVEVTSTCGCIQIPRKTGVELSRWGRLTPIEMLVQPGKFDARVSSTVTLYDSDRKEHAVRVVGEIVRPFAGWPTAACAKRDGRVVTVPCDPRWMPHIGSAFIETADGRQAAIGAFLPDPGVILFTTDEEFALDGSAVLRLIGDAASPWEWTGQVLESVCASREAALSPLLSMLK